jgi:hypothetical protein
MGNQNGNGKPRPAVALAMEHAREELSQSEYLVLIVIASYAAPDSRAWPSYSAIGHRPPGPRQRGDSEACDQRTREGRRARGAFEGVRPSHQRLRRRRGPNDSGHYG